MKQTKITADLEAFEEMVKGLGGEYVTRVGILGSKNSRQDGGTITNAEIGAIHELGSIENNIPPRSFLRMPLEIRKEELIAVFEKTSVKKAIGEGDYEKVHTLIGIQAEAIIQEAFSTGGFGQWPALAPETVKAKGSSAILIDTSELRRAQTSDVVKKGDL